jgi:hypothetical protein
MLRVATIVLSLGLGAFLIAPPLLAQSPPAPPTPGLQMGPQMHGHPMHGHHMTTPAAGAPTRPGQDAFGAIAEVVRLLEADPNTDWSTVDLERLRQHLIDMNEVVLRSDVKSSPIPGGLRLTMTARTPEDAKTVARIRGLGFVGLLVQGGHHGPHHLAMAKGQALPGHRH